MVAPTLAPVPREQQFDLLPPADQICNQSSTIASLPGDVLLSIFSLLKSNPRDVLSFAKSCKRTYKFLAQALATFETKRPLELFLNAIILNNRFDKVLPPLGSQTSGRQLVLSLSCQDVHTEKTTLLVLQNIAHLHTLRLHVGAASQAQTAFGKIALALSNGEASHLRTLILTGTCPLQKLEQVVRACPALQTLDIRACRMVSEVRENGTQLVLGSSSNTPSLQSIALCDLYVAVDQYLLTNEEAFRQLFANCPSLQRVHISCFEGVSNPVDLSIGVVVRGADFSMQLQRLMNEFSKMAHGEVIKQFLINRLNIQPDAVSREFLKKTISPLPRDLGVIEPNSATIAHAHLPIQIVAPNQVQQGSFLGTVLGRITAFVSRYFPFSR